ncbi:hypothetical protein [Neorhizobium galegae]|uniref:hypothetical protein n=1 Tax=Neorhizobium galegae TaxID=399 RepID=UPI000621A998|nr:hypothetical protein [Neorhizobium galegae]CDZ55078.1 Hypothetical protein NGAL_HAMBI2427_59840 [Neorhizobium galegae bv. orientalis]
MAKVITLCGSSRFPQAFELANMHLSLQGNIVIGLSCYGHADAPTGAKFLTSDGNEAAPEKQALDQLHFRKIDLSDEIFVINVGGYVGSSTRREIAYAQSKGKAVRLMFDAPSPAPKTAGFTSAEIEEAAAHCEHVASEYEARANDPNCNRDHYLRAAERKRQEAAAMRSRAAINPPSETKATVEEYATRLFSLHGFMLCEEYRGKYAVTVTFPDLKEAQQFHGTLVELSQHRPRDRDGGLDK